MIATVLGTIAIVAVAIAIGVVVDRRLGLLPRAERLRAAGQPRPRPRHTSGAAPSTAVRADAAQLERLRAGPTCPHCRTEMSAQPDDTVRFAGRELLVLAFRCPACASKRAIYVDAGA